MLLVRDFRTFDLPYLVDIDRKCYPKPWEEEDFNKFARWVGVGVVEGTVVAYFVYQIASYIKLLRFGVHPNWRRCGCGSKMMDALFQESKEFRKITTMVPETSEGTHLFLRHNGFRCVNTVPNAFEDLGVREAGYYFVRKLDVKIKQTDTV